MNGFDSLKIKNTVQLWQEFITNKLRSRDVALKGQECMRKLRSMTLQDSSADDSVLDDCSASHNVTQTAERIIVDTLPKTSAMAGKEFCNPPRKAPKKRLKFTEEEDASPVKGINKYGIGRWKTCFEIQN